MDKLNDGGNAFPMTIDMRTGMSLRDYFAGQALKNLICNYYYYEINIGIEEIAKLSFQIADAMLVARNGKEG